nr:acyl carrier protein [Streptomyces sp. HNM0574]
MLVQKFGADPVAVGRPDSPLRQLGLDSLALEELRLHIESRLDVDLDDAELTSRDTVGRLVEVVQVRAAA